MSEVQRRARICKCRSSFLCVERRARQSELLGSWSCGRVATCEGPPRVRNHLVGRDALYVEAPCESLTVSGRDATYEEALCESLTFSGKDTSYEEALCESLTVSGRDASYEEALYERSRFVCPSVF